jgi:hypothetical protein
MDKELAQLEEWAVNLVNDYEEELLRTKPKSSMHKRIKRFSGELVANPEAYGELLEMGRSQGMTGQELLNAIRRIEQGLLDEAGRGKAPSRKQMMSDVIHHFYAQRTGGDTLRRLGQADRQEARAALRSEFGRWGNVPENLRSLFRAGHLNSDVLKGIEGEAMAELGVTQAKQLDLPKAHTTTGKAVTGDIVGATTAKEAIEGMRPQFEIQGRETQAAIDATQPLMTDIDKIAGSTYSTGMSELELETRRNILSANPEQVKAAIQTRLSPFIRAGVVNLGMSVISEYGEAVDEITDGAISNTINKAVVNPIRKALGQEPVSYQKPDPQADVKTVKRAKTAVQRGGQISFGAGGVKFTLPEFGLSEILGFN